MIFKQELRQQARARRAGLPDIAAALAAQVETLGVRSGQVIGGYHAHRGEADPALLLARLVEQGCHIAFPRVVEKDGALEFHRVPDGAVLQPGAFGIAEPLAHWPRVTPDMLLVPLLAFDAKGTRLGQGGGFYDRVLERLKVPAIGIAHAAQEMDFIPCDPHDRTLDAILTEQGLRRFHESSVSG